MIYITLHNLHSWGKTHMTKAGDICVAASLANETDDKTVYAAATLEKDLEEVRELYPDVKFEVFDASRLTKDDAVVIPILEFSRIVTKTRDSLIRFYKDLIETEATLFVMNIHHNRDFYKKTLWSCEDEEVAELVEQILSRCKYLVHDDCMRLEDSESTCIEQIVFYDKSKIKDIKFDDERDVILTFYRPSSFKGFNLWLKETETEKNSKLVAVCNTGVNKSYHELVKAYKNRGLITVYPSIREYLDNPCEGHALISAPYSIESEDFQELIRRSNSCLSTTDYRVLAALNDGVAPDYLVLENAMFDASMHGLVLRWSESSIETMPTSTANDCRLLNEMTYDEQVKVFSGVYDAKKYLAKIEEMNR